MLKKNKLWLMTIMFFLAGYYYLNCREVRVIAVHQNGYTAQVLVNQLPYSAKSSINWWVDNQKTVLPKDSDFHFDSKIPGMIVIYAFGEGYQVEDADDRLCFDDVTPPYNCIDKDILMIIYRTKEGHFQFQRRGESYSLNQQGKIVKEKT